MQLEINLIADVGLLGFPNAGKSTFLAQVSNAKPKIASLSFHHASIRFGNDGICTKKLVFADIPGLIKDAAAGAGLGHDFLRHLNRCQILIDLIDPCDSLGLINSYPNYSGWNC